MLLSWYLGEKVGVDIGRVYGPDKEGETEPTLISATVGNNPPTFFPMDKSL